MHFSLQQGHVGWAVKLCTNKILQFLTGGAGQCGLTCIMTVKRCCCCLISLKCIRFNFGCIATADSVDTGSECYKHKCIQKLLWEWYFMPSPTLTNPLSSALCAHILFSLLFIPFSKYSYSTSFILWGRV